ncbi:hypothetical protein CY34DRAFT_605694 [Suillus luteus UH-Slu-Lm8-n1]|uniref:Uncharacterized protein n=1 Tax=Suillus luteus UH-Slu-Lm8-n1 TaxID=930992 RepID=A0A0D0ASG2_9AGAM|nr:hypothetical protein CY34DRAFT_605694 [Suillus luteus UH-Slu-Lm8-n1]
MRLTESASRPVPALYTLTITHETPPYVTLMVSISLDPMRSGHGRVSKEGIPLRMNVATRGGPSAVDSGIKRSHAELATVPLMSRPRASVEERATPIRPYHSSWRRRISKSVRVLRMACMRTFERATFSRRRIMPPWIGLGWEG